MHIKSNNGTILSVQAHKYEVAVRDMNRQQQQQRLIDQAASHGPYLWTKRDVENALLWFKEDGDNFEEESNKNRSEFLRRLLHSRGICVQRPILERSINNKKRKLKYGDDDDAIKDGKSKIRSDNKRKKRMDSPLQSILTGYYYQSPQSSTTLLSAPPDSKDGDDNTQFHFTASDIEHAELSTSKLLNDLSIVSSRQHTNEIYQAYMNVIGKEKEKDNNATKWGAACKTVGKVNETIQMSTTIDTYMTHPTTCTKRVYASKVFDQLINLCNNNIIKQGHSDSNNDENDALQRYIEKLFGLASDSSNTNDKIQEVIMLLLLEPVRRLQHLAQGEISYSSSDNNLQCMSPLQNRSVQDDNSEYHQQCRNFSPLLASSHLWAINSSDKVEQACLQPPLPSLVQFILQSSPKSMDLFIGGDDDDNLAAHASADAGGSENQPSSSTTISWWTLPSPLLCMISQLYFPIACKYIRYWIEMAVVSHGQLYNSSPITNQALLQSEGTNCTKEVNEKEKESFQQAIERIKQFHATSDRLKLLGNHILHTMEKESSSGSTMDVELLSEEEQNAAFRRSLAWRSIHNTLE